MAGDNHAHRRKFLLSGLLHCGCCGAPYVMMAQERFECSTHRRHAWFD
ncbi:zinc ribbon domain-containing protein [Acidocella sp.]